jgi:Rod binding domain-containing protein
MDAATAQTVRSTLQPSGQDRHQQLTHTAQRWVSQTFFGTILRQMHNSPFKSQLFSGGRGGEAFSTLLDQQLADRMGRGAGSSLVASIVRHIERAGRRDPGALQVEHGLRAARAARVSNSRTGGHVDAAF